MEQLKKRSIELGKYEQIVEEAMQEAIGSPEVQEQENWSDLIRGNIEEEVRAEPSSYLSKLSALVQECEDLENDLHAKKNEATQAKVPWSRVGMLVVIGLVIALVLLTMVVIGRFTSIRLPLSFLEDLPGWIVILGAILTGGFASTIIQLAVERERSRRGEISRLNLHIPDIESKIERAHDRLKEGLVREILLPLIREKIASAKPSESDCLPSEMIITGLSEVRDLKYEVPTQARQRLGRLIDKMKEGTIGLAGPRGVGKSTVLESFCKPDLPNTSLEDKTLRIQVSAPIQYDARDFLLHLFSELCYSILRLTGFRRKEVNEIHEGKASADTEKSDEKLRRRIEWLLQILTLSSAIIGLMWLAIAAVGWYAAKKVPAGGEAPTSLFAQVIAGIVTNAETGLIFLGIGIVLFVAKPFIYRWMYRSLRLSKPISPFPYLPTQIDVPEGWPEVIHNAFSNLKTIHFQQSYSSGWKGSLNVSFIGIDRSETESIATKQRTLPAIITEFKVVIDSVPLKNPVIIAIDELDKMESTDKIERFLNDIKSIFGLRKCVYLLSVSESAMSRFARRGLPMRDTFDSTFDEIIRVTYFDLDSSMKLLNRRVIGLPIPFQALCHSVSGGLPRDLIRICRKLFSLNESLGDESPTLTNLAKLIVKSEIAVKVEAAHIEIRKIDVEPELRDFLLMLQRLKAVDSPDELLNISGELWLFGVKTALSETLQEDDRSQLLIIANLSKGLAAYMYYLSTLSDVCGFPIEKRKVENWQIFEDLAQIRQSLELNPGLTISQINAFRKTLKVGLKVPDWAVEESILTEDHESKEL